MPAIINSGAAYIAAVNAGEMAVTDFVLAYIEGLDHTQPVNPAETLPAAGNIVHTAPVTQSGYLAPDKVVYSLAMDSGVGDFTFNWLGLRGEDGTLIAVAYLPATEKTATAGGVQGNNITRNFLLQFSDAQLATGITVPAETWQVDVSAYLNAMDDRTRLSNLDLYGRAAFFGDGWKIVLNDGTYQMNPGVGYVGGVRIVCTAPIALDIGNTDQQVIIYLDVALQKKGDRVEPEIKVVFQFSADYIDSAGNRHVIAPVAIIDQSEILDGRRVLDAPQGVVHFLQYQIDQKAPLHSPVLTGNPTAPTQGFGSNNNRLATTAFVQAAIDYLFYHQTDDLSTIANLAEAIQNDPFFGHNVYQAIAQRAPVEHKHAPADVGVRTAYKPESTHRNNTTSTSPDPDLRIYDLEYNSFYKIEGFLRITNPGSSQGTRILLIRDNSSGVLTNTAVNVSYVESTSDENSGFRRAARGHLVTIGGSVSSELFVKFSGFIVTGASGVPNWELAWGQSSSSGSNTTFHKGSWIRAEKIG